MIKPLCKECGGRHWSHEPHSGAASRSNEEIMGAGRFAKPANAPPQPAPVVRNSPQEVEDLPPAAGTGSLPVGGVLDQPVGDDKADPTSQTMSTVEKRKSYAREYQRKLREQRKKDRQA